MADDLVSFFWFNLLVAGLLLFDSLVIHKKAHVISVREAAYWSVFWIALSLIFNGYIYLFRGTEDALDFFTGYLIEKSLSVDNLFVFVLIFKYFQTPKKHEYKVLFLGILGAIAMRALFILVGVTLLHKFHWIIYLLGVFLIFTGIHFALGKEQKVDPEKNRLIRLLRYFFPITSKHYEGRFFVYIDKVLHATPLFAALIAIETTDLIFALDSIPAILAITSDPFIAYTSNIFAVLGLRSLYFCLSHFIALFQYLHYGLALILIFIGAKMLLSDIVHIPTSTALLIVAAILIVFSLVSYLLLEKKEDIEKPNP